MRFESIALHNFMRYKGENRIEFSCEERKNVTVILGDNTVGRLRSPRHSAGVCMGLC